MNERSITLVGAIANILLAGLKTGVGFFAGSRALVADGVHSLSDLVTDVAVYLGVYAADRPPDENHTFGHGRYETISALFVGLVLVSAGIGVGFDAGKTILEILHGNLPPRPGLVAAAVALASILVKEVMFRITRRAGIANGSPAVTANAWHHRSDALSSLAALIGISAAAVLDDRWRIMDPIAALLVAVLVVYVGVKIVWTALHEMTDAALPAEDCRQILRDVGAVTGVSDPHNLKTRRLGTTVAVEVHIRVDGGISVNEGHAIATEVETTIKARYGDDTRVITHVEPEKKRFMT